MSGIFWLASYPKSGNTWLRVFLSNYRSDASSPANINELDSAGIGFTRYDFDECLGIDSTSLTLNQIEHYRPRVYEKMAADSDESLFLKVHDAFTRNSSGEPIFSKQATAGVIYLTRNPLDIVVSYAHHRKKPIDDTIKFMGCRNSMLVSNNHESHLPQKMMSWSDHVNSWLDEPDLNICALKYEEMIKDPIAAFSKAVEFVGFPFDENRIKKAIEFSSFEKLKAQEAKYGFGEKHLKAESFFRNGKMGSWKDKLSASEIQKVTSDHFAVMRRFGYSA